MKTIEFEDSCNLCGGKNSNCKSCGGAEPKTISLQIKDYEKLVGIEKEIIETELKIAKIEWHLKKLKRKRAKQNHLLYVKYGEELSEDEKVEIKKLANQIRLEKSDYKIDLMSLIGGNNGK